MISSLYFFGGFLMGAGLIGFLVYRTLSNSFQQKNQSLRENLQNMQFQLEISDQVRKEVDENRRTIQDLMEQKFENLANKIFEEKSQKFNDQNLRGLSHILDPIRDRLKEFEKKVDETYSSERTERGVLRGELNKLLELNRTMSQEASNLTKALKGENKTQGNWGELILENVLERSGLRKGEEYIVQGSEMGIKDAEGLNLRPDVIIQLPDCKHLIVDSKMTLNAYDSYSSEEDSLEREKYGKLHVEALKRHIDGLSEKKYYLAEKLLSPDFVILFMPLEPAFALAIRLKPDLFQYAWDRNIAIVSPTTLLSTLRTVSTLWRQDRQERNVLEIARRGGLLYEKFVGLLKDLETLGDRLSGASKVHGEVIKKLSEGKGNLVDQVEELKRLGVKTEKSIPPNYLTNQSDLQLNQPPI